MRTRRLLLLATVAALALTSVASAGTTKLSGPGRVAYLGGVNYTAHGLKAGTYALLARRNLTHDGVDYRCQVHMAAPREASGTEAFHGSMPGGVTCVGAEDPTRTYDDEGFHPGRWMAVVCVPTDQLTCVRGTTVERKSLTVTRR